MEMVNCPRCGKLYTKIRDNLCPECLKEEEETFHKVKEYIEEHRECTLDEVSRETGVSLKRIMKYLREGRIEISKASKDLKCGQCGKPITSGKFCDSCIITINQQVQDMMLESQKNKTIIMHTKHK